ncbi:MAG TPA: HAMP domain-containing sensor histidine kinase [Armatimonadota bacterium]|nr:HAMP domain-containing sensor histidine kinase [Armatimonadota bacterium]
MGTRPATYLLAAVFIAFAIWELIEHVLLMDLPMAAYHIISLTIEFGIVLGLALVAMRILRQRSQSAARQHALHDTVVAALAQDVRPPLVSLLTELRLMERAPPEGMSEQTRELLRQASARAGVLVGMIEDLVAMTEEAGVRPAACVNLTPSEIAREVLAPHRLLAKERDVTLKEDLSEGPAAVCAPADQLVQALSTLLGTAIRATPRGGEVRLTVHEDGGMIAFAVTDSAGPVLAHGASLSEAASGPDRVGLRYCQTVAEALGGSARYEPTETGNRYSFSLPARRHGR